MFDVFTAQMTEIFSGSWLRLLAAVAILVIGWILAAIISGMVRSGLRRLKLDQRLSQWMSGNGEVRSIRSERVISKIFYYVLLALVLVAFFQALNLTLAVEPINAMLAEILAYLPNLLGALLLLVLAWIVATILRALVQKGLTLVRFDERIGGVMDRDVTDPAVLTNSLSAAVYWIVLLVFLPAVLDALRLDGLLGPVHRMLEPALQFLPNLFSAALILLIGLFLAYLIRGIVTNLLVLAGVDKLGDRIGFGSAENEKKLSSLLGLIVYILILIPVIIGTLDALRLDAITRPASNMLDVVLQAVPNIFVAAFLLIVAFLVGRLLAKLATELLTKIGFNALPEKLGFGRVTAAGERTFSEIAGSLLLVGIMLVVALEALNLLHFNLVADLLQTFLQFIGSILIGLLIFLIGLYLANLAANALSSSGSKYPVLLPMVARIAIIVMSAAMALQHMGVADQIVLIGFGLLFGAVAVSFAIAFGIGGIKIATQYIEKWLDAQKR